MNNEIRIDIGTHICLYIVINVGIPSKNNYNGEQAFFGVPSGALRHTITP